mmetsp:Transcript_8008/g.15971  ORF Transcript_8008/g.15971 Transcript_8008/m.15971 type:complete len:250 (+) Transcript_8008:1698-2447(+)
MRRDLAGEAALHHLAQRDGVDAPRLFRVRPPLARGCSVPLPSDPRQKQRHVRLRVDVAAHELENGPYLGGERSGSLAFGYAVPEGLDGQGEGGVKVHGEVLLAVDGEDEQQVRAPLPRGLYPVRQLLEQRLEEPLGVAPDKEPGPQPGPLGERRGQRVDDVRPAVAVHAVLPPLDDVVRVLGLVLPPAVLDSLHGHLPRAGPVVPEEAEHVRQEPSVVVVPVRQARDEEAQGGASASADRAVAVLADLG